MLENEEAMALAKFLGVDVEDIEENGAPHTYTVRGSNEEYFVADYDDSYEAAKQDVKDLFDDLGLESFTESARNYILEKFCNYPWEEAVEENNRSYCEAISSEKASDGVCANRLVEECIDEGIIFPEDCQKNKDGLLDYEDEYELIDKYTEKLNEKYSSMEDWFENVYGRNWTEDSDVQQILVDYIDLDEVADYCISLDGIAHTLNRYDGSEEVEEINGTDYYIYRQN